MKRKILFFLVAALFAFALWIYVVTVVSPESEATYYNIPVILNNAEVLLRKDLMVTDGGESSVTLQLRGNRSDLRNLKNSDITIEADLSKINGAGIQTLSCNVYFNGYGASNFEIIGQTPNVITLTIAERSTKNVPVQVNYAGSLGLDYIAYQDEAVLEHTFVTITGPKSVVDQVSQAAIDIDLEGQVESIDGSFRYVLQDVSGNVVDDTDLIKSVDQIHFALKIQRVKNVQLVLDVTYGGGATMETTSIVLSNTEIKVSGSEKLMENLDTLVLSSVDLAEISEDTILTFPVILEEGLENLSGITEVTAEITFPGLAVKSLFVSNIIATNKPDNMVADIAAKLVTVTVRGPVDLIERVQPENITILVDLSQAELGDNRLKAQIVLDPTFDTVGVIGTYNVVVTLQEQPQEAEDTQ